MTRNYDEALFDNFYRDVEAVSNHCVSRGDLVMVDGYTIREKMAEAFLAQGNDPARFDRYYRENVAAETKRYVREALADDGYVELFPVNRDGSIPDEPEQLTGPGQGERILSEEDAKYIQETRDRVKMININAQRQMEARGSLRRDEYLGDWMKEHHASNMRDVEKEIGKNPRGLTLGRSALISFSVLLMTDNGYSIDDICDMNKLQKEKQAAGREIIDRIQKKDYMWLGEKLVSGQKKLLDQLDERMQQIDLSDNHDLLSQRNVGLLFLAQCAADAQQEMPLLKEEVMSAAAKYEPENPKKFWNELDSRAITMRALIDGVGKTLDAGVQMSNGVVPAKHLLLGTFLSGEALLRQYHKARKANPDTPCSRLFTETTPNYVLAKGYSSLISGNQTFKDIGTAMDDPDTLRIFGRRCLDGALPKSMDLEVDLETGTVSLGIDRTPRDIRSAVYGKMLETELPKFEMDFSAGIAESVAELKSADPRLIKSSEQYKSMQASAQYMSKLVLELDNPPTYLQARKFQLAAESMKEKAEEYLEYKERKHSGSSIEQRRIEAAKNLLELSNEMLRSGKELLQGFDRIPEMIDQKEQFEEKMRQKDVAVEENMRKAVEGDSVLKQQFKEMEVKEAEERNRKTAAEITEHLTEKYGSGAPDAYRVPGSMMEIRTKDGNMQSVSAVEKLGQDIMGHKASVINYINGNIPADENMRKKMSSDVRHTIARMALMEQIVIERAQKGFKKGDAKAKAGELEQAYAKNPTECLKSIRATTAFHDALKDMKPEKLKDFIMKDGARNVARIMQAEVKEKVKANNREEQIPQRISDAPKKEPQMIGK